MTFKKVVIGSRGFNFMTYPKMGSSNVMYGIVQNPKMKGLNPNGTKKKKHKKG